MKDQIFYDPSGARWKLLKLFFVLIAILVGYVGYSFIPLVLSPQSTAHTANAAFDSNIILQSTGNKNVPVIGQGPLIRVVHLKQSGKKRIAIDVQSLKPTVTLSQKETTATEGHSYAIERYGHTAGKRIALTFDDGPDPTYSPQLLDLLAREGAVATFFVVGEGVVKYPDIANRMVREGHILGNHTFSHVNFDFADMFTTTQEMNQTRRVIRAATQHDSIYFRIPYGGSTDQDMRDSLAAILEAQKLGYVISSFNFDTSDWDKLPSDSVALPSLAGTDDITMLLHDGGGDRTYTLDYVQQLISAAKQHGYTFATLDQLYAAEPPRFYKQQSDFFDQLSLAIAQVAIVWPRSALSQLFVLTLVSLLLGLIVHSVLAVLQTKKRSSASNGKKYRPLVSVIVPAYNEESVLHKTTRSILRSHYRQLELIIIDDGSSDNTLAVAQKIARSSTRVQVLSQPNLGKAAAVNQGISVARGEVIICLDADTVFTPQTIGQLSRHFKTPTVGAVAGVVKVGNINSMLTRWQALEYTSGIFLERNAHAYLNAIMIVPGACGAWRRQAIVDAGGFSTKTLAEDCDLTLSVRRAGYDIIQDTTAIGYTEAPNSIQALAQQRFRWIFGTMQAIWNHRSMLFNERYGWLGLFVLPFAVFNIIMPLLFIPILTTFAIENIIAGHITIMLIFLGITLGIQFVMALVSIILAREKASLLLAVPLTRLVYSPLKGYLLYRAILTAFRGKQVGWNKLQRRGTVQVTSTDRMHAKT